MPHRPDGLMDTHIFGIASWAQECMLTSSLLQPSCTLAGINNLVCPILIFLWRKSRYFICMLTSRCLVIAKFIIPEQTGKKPPICAYTANNSNGNAISRYCTNGSAITCTPQEINWQHPLCQFIHYAPWKKIGGCLV